MSDDQFGYVQLPFGFYYLTAGDPKNFFGLGPYKQVWGRLFRLGKADGYVEVRFGR